MRLLLVVLLLAGCAAQRPSPASNIPMGDAVEQPYGFAELCERDPSVPECGGKR